jgi:hypothetical protein
MKSVIKLTDLKDQAILVGAESIIDAHSYVIDKNYGKEIIHCSKIRSRGAMVETNYVKETIEEIYNLINQ